MSIVSSANVFPYPTSCNWLNQEDDFQGLIVSSTLVNKSPNPASEAINSQKLQTTQNTGKFTGYLTLFNFHQRKLEIADIFKFDYGISNLEVIKTDSESTKKSNIVVIIDNKCNISLFKM